MTTPRLSLAYLYAGQDGRVPHNANMNRFDALVAASIKDRDLTSPPAASEGDVYIVGASATGAWAGEDGKIAQYIGGEWEFYTPVMGMRGWVEDEASMVIRLSGSWKAVTGESIFSARDAAGGMTVNGSWANVLWDTQDRIDGVFDHSTGSNQDQIELLEAGDYEVTVSVTVATSATTANNRIDVKLTLDASDVAGSFATGNVHHSTFQQVTITLTKIVNATAGQILRVAVQRVSGTSTIATVAGYSRVHVRRV